jgi:alkaline phosphatase D
MNLTLIIGLFGLASAAQSAAVEVHFACGVKVGEVTDSSAVIWTRLTAKPDRNLAGVAWAEGADRVPEGRSLAEMEGSVAGAPGEVRLQWWPRGGVGLRLSTDWAPVNPERDFTHQFLVLDQLRAQTEYLILVEGRPLGAEEAECNLIASFRTAPEEEASAPATFTVITGQEYARRDDKLGGHQIFAHMQVLNPDFFVHTGDVVYHDKPGPFAKSPELARYKWNRIYSMPLQRSFHATVPAWFMTDDHDVLKNDCWPGQSYGELSWDEGLSIFREQTPTGPRPYRRLRWGRDLEVWFVEGREFRSPNDMEDGPLKSIWGAEQKAWFFETFAASDATFRVLVSSTPVVGPDRSGKKDNHANKAFKSEGDELRAFLATQKDAYVICGDRHWQYISEDSGIREYSCGPTTDRHAGGFSQKNRSDTHRYLKVCGGFLAVSLDYPEDEATLTFRHHAADGSVNNEDVRAVADQLH